MSVFGNIMSAIFGHSAGGAHGAAAGSTPPSSTPAAAAPSAPPQPAVDVEAVLTKLASQNKEKLDWRKSIVDLLKLLQLDSSLATRKELAKELRYTAIPTIPRR